MNIENITVKYCHTGAFEHSQNNGLKHIKRVPYLAIVQATEGFYSFSLYSQPQKNLKTGEFYISPSLALQTITHNTDPKSNTMSARWVYMDIVVNDHVPFDRAFSLPVFPNAALCHDLNTVFDRIFASDNIIDRKIGCYELIKVILPYASETQDGNPIVKAALSYIHKHYGEHLTIETIAAAINASPTNLYRLFKRVTGVTPMDYCNSVRLSHACELLSGNQYTIVEIANLCGVSDPSYFNKLFKKKFAVTPNAYRTMQRKTRYTE